MEMKDKLHKKKPRVKWYQLVRMSLFLDSNFESWLKKKKRKIKSLDRLAYSFLRSFLGISFINHIRELASKGCLYLENDYISRIAKVPWIDKYAFED